MRGSGTMGTRTMGTKASVFASFWFWHLFRLARYFKPTQSRVRGVQEKRFESFHGFGVVCAVACHGLKGN